jgi:hypothetical protein
MNDKLTAYLDAVEALANDATQGPWTTDVDEYEEKVGDIAIPEINRLLHSGGQEWSQPDEWDRDLANAEFIAASRTDVPRLLRLVRFQDEALRSIASVLADSTGKYKSEVDRSVEIAALIHSLSLQVDQLEQSI